MGKSKILPGDVLAGHTLRVIVVNDHDSVPRTICRVLRSQAAIEAVWEAKDGADAARKIREHEPDVVLVDITMPTMNGLEAAEIIKTEFPSVQVLIVSQHDSRGFQGATLAADMSGYVNKSNVGRDLIPELRRIQCLPRSACDPGGSQPGWPTPPSARKLLSTGLSWGSEQHYQALPSKKCMDSNGRVRERVVSSIRDNGVGFHPQARLMELGKKGLGLIGLQELQIESEPGRGTHLLYYCSAGEHRCQFE